MDARCRRDVRPPIATARGAVSKRIGGGESADLSTARFIIDHGGDATAGRRGAPWITDPARRCRSVWLSRRRCDHRLHDLVAHQGVGALAAARAVHDRAAEGDRFSNTGVHVVALSADGTRLAYTANTTLPARDGPARRRHPSAAPKSPATAAAGRSPFFSPDGRWIGFWQGGQLKKVSITGGAPLMLCAAENPLASVGRATTRFSTGKRQGAGKGAAGIWRVSSEGGKPEQVVKVEAGQIAHGPQLLPGGRAILFTLARRGDWDTAQIVVQSLDTGRRHVVVERGADARYVPTGHLVYALDGTLLAVPFDVTTLAVTGGRAAGGRRGPGSSWISFVATRRADGDGRRPLRDVE